ncbi:hypothetical protein H5410_014104 [Solanum commersonii]|uniref:DUF4283 domain-containing protein n=1 Tax=Solanum commersonii TaxID=4109 RepID=A0A9J5ZQ23_SOLCO|nr:hypothetical protein H5410_014104 [Solanum commersonii]
MATVAVGQPPPVEVAPTPQGVINNLGQPSTTSYANTIKPKSPPHKPVPMKQIAYLHGEPKRVWEEEEVEQMIINESLQYVVVGKFSTTILEDYATLLSKPQFYIILNQWSYPMRTLKWDPMFNPKEETSIAIAWISLPALLPIFFGNEAIFSLALAVGKPLQVDTATLNKTRPREITEKWIVINYDYVPKYCKSCKLQGHNEKECFIIHPELYPKKDDEEAEKIEKKKALGVNLNKVKAIHLQNK